jgi:hypothetical protein
MDLCEFEDARIEGRTVRVVSGHPYYAGVRGVIGSRIGDDLAYVLVKDGSRLVVAIADLAVAEPMSPMGTELFAHQDSDGDRLMVEDWPDARCLILESTGTLGDDGDIRTRWFAPDVARLVNVMTDWLDGQSCTCGHPGGWHDVTASECSADRCPCNMLAYDA